MLTPAARHQWLLSLSHQPARYTALYFNNPGALPSTVVRGRRIRVSFTIDNLEGRAISYRYLLTSTGARTSRLLGEASRTLTPGAAWSVSEQVSPECGASSCLIGISLPGHPERIDFAITLRAAQRGKHA